MEDFLMNKVKLETLDVLTDALNDAINEMKAAEPDANKRHRDSFYADCLNLNVFVFGVLQRRILEKTRQKDGRITDSPERRAQEAAGMAGDYLQGIGLTPPRYRACTSKV